MSVENMFSAGRAAAGLTQVEAASICGLSTEAYRTREKNPGEFRLKELKLLAKSTNKNASEILIRATRSFFLES